MNMNRCTPFLFSTFLVIIFALQLEAEEAPPWGPKIIKLGDITISCEAYEKYYRDIVEDAAKNNSAKWNAAAKSRLDEAFGTYKTAWIRNSTNIIDKYGKKLPTHKSIHDIECKTSYRSERVYHDSHHGSWDTNHIPYTEKKHKYDRIRLGYVDDCSIRVTQDIWPELGKCGTGTIIRNFKIGVWCGSREYTLKLSQKIHVVPSCSFSQDMVHVPDVQWMCGPIKYKDKNHIELPDYIKPVKIYDGWETSCHSSKIYVSYHDTHYKLIQEHRKYVIIRTWVYSDHCSGKKFHVEQKIMVDGECRDDDDPDDKPDKPDKPDEPDTPEEPDDTVQFALLNELEDIYLSHETYLNTYKDVVDLSLESYRKGQTDLSAELLNAIFGKYEIQSDTTQVDSVTIYSMECNDGDPIDSEFKLENGVLQADCPETITIEQKLSQEYTNCGTSGLERQFIVRSVCDTTVMRDTFTQKIIFSPTCALSAFVFDVPPDTVLCGTLERDSANRIILPVTDQPRYVGDSMRSFEVDYKFLVAYSSEDPNRIEVSRVWTYTDTCLSEATMLTQEVVLMDTCQTGLEKAMSNQIVHTVSKEDIEPGISKQVREAEILDLPEVSASSLKASVSPNPFTNEVKVNFHHSYKGRADVRVLDSRGAFLTNRSYDFAKGDQQIYLGEEVFNAPGMYILQLISGDQVENLKVIYQGD